MILDAFLAKFYKAVIVMLLVLLAAAIAFGSWKHFAHERSEAQREADIAEAIKPYEDAIDQAQKEKATIMQTWSAKIIEVEQNAIKKYKVLMLPLVVLTWLLLGCQSNSAKPTNVCPQLPKKSSLITLLPTVSYSKLAQQNIEEWQKKQMDMQLMQ